MVNIPGIKVIKLNLFISERFEKELNILAKIIDREKQCVNYLAWRKSIIEEINRRLQNVNTDHKIRVYWSSSAKGGYNTSNNQNGASRVISMANGINIADNLPLSTAKVSPEWIISESPDMIISHAAYIRHVSGMNLGYALLRMLRLFTIQSD